MTRTLISLEFCPVLGWCFWIFSRQIPLPFTCYYKHDIFYFVVIFLNIGMFSFHVSSASTVKHKQELLKEYFPNLLVIRYIVSPNLCFLSQRPQVWLLAYFLILLSCVKFQQDWATLIFWIFGRLRNQKTSYTYND